MSEPVTAQLAEAYARALFDAARGLGRCERDVELVRLELGELRSLVKEELSINYRDHDERIAKLETRAAQQRASWKTVTGLAAAVTGGSGLVSLGLDWLRHR
jgi:hypothetical protein